MPGQSTRLLSLDAFRGFTILAMLLVNNAALGSYAPDWLSHAEWSGSISFADLVFPWFLLMVGLSIPLSWTAAQKHGATPSSFRIKAARRALNLFLLGLLLVSSVAHTPVFSLGVLQLIALAFFGAAWLRHLSARERTLLAFGLLLAHWAILRYLPVPGVEVQEFAPGKTWPDWLNANLFATWHLNGLFSLVPTLALTLIGTVVGERMAEVPPSVRKFAELTGIALALLVAGYLWSLDIPFNKPLWTASYITFTAGLGVMLLALMYLVADLWGFSRLAFLFGVCGANAIFAYVVPILVKVFIFWGWTIPVGDTRVSLLDAALDGCRAACGAELGGWVFTAAYIGLWWAVLAVMYRRRIFWKV